MAAVAKPDLTPQVLFAAFEQGRYRPSMTAFRKFLELRDKRPFLEPAVDFLANERDDPKRAWATSVLGQIGGRRAFDALMAVLETERDQSQLLRFRYTRFFGLANATRMA